MGGHDVCKLHWRVLKASLPRGAVKTRLRANGECSMQHLTISRTPRSPAADDRARDLFYLVLDCSIEQLLDDAHAQPHLIGSLDPYIIFLKRVRARLKAKMSP